jgi:hypothetical protein
MRPVVVTVGPLTASTGNNIALTQTPGGAGNLTLNGTLVTAGVAILPNAEKVTLTTTDATHTATINGTSWAGDKISELITFTGSAVTSVLSYKTITSISVSAALSAAITVGTSGIGYSPWVRLDEYAAAQVSITTSISGTVNYTVQQSNDDPNSPTNPVLPSAVAWLPSADSNAVGAAANIATFFTYAPLWVRLLLNSGTGSVTATIVQLGVAPY